MNIGLMLKRLNNRIRSDGFKIIPINDIAFFEHKNDWMTDLLLLSSIWNDIEFPDQVFICNQLIGRNKSEDLRLLLRWINESRDIDNFSLIVGLDTWCKDDDYSVEIKPILGQEWINKITVTHRPTSEHRWKECRNTYPEEERDIIEMLITILKRELNDQSK